MFRSTNYEALKICRMCSRVSNVMINATLHPTEVNNNLHINSYDVMVCVCVCVCVWCVCGVCGVTICMITAKELTSCLPQQI